MVLFRFRASLNSLFESVILISLERNLLLQPNQVFSSLVLVVCVWAGLFLFGLFRVEWEELEREQRNFGLLSHRKIILRRVESSRVESHKHTKIQALTILLTSVILYYLYINIHICHSLFLMIFILSYSRACEIAVHHWNCNALISSKKQIQTIENTRSPMMNKHTILLFQAHKYTYIWTNIWVCICAWSLKEEIEKLEDWKLKWMILGFALMTWAPRTPSKKNLNQKSIFWLRENARSFFV